MWIFYFFFQTSKFYVGFEVLTAVIINVAILWDIAPYSPYLSRRFGNVSFPSSGQKNAGV
jgi:hypothetical protein